MVCNVRNIVDRSLTSDGYADLGLAAAATHVVQHVNDCTVHGPWSFPVAGGTLCQKTPAVWATS